MTLREGELYVPSSPGELRDDMLADYRLEARKYSSPEPAVTPGSDNWFFFTGVANAGYLQYGNIATIRPAITPLTAQGEDLENWRVALGLPVVQASPASGKLTVTISGGGAVSFPDGQQFLYPSGLRGKVAGSQFGILDQQDVNVIAIDAGADTNLASGQAVRWVNPPLNVATEARVSINGPLTGGYDEETEERKRERVLNRLQNTPGGGNWGQLREIAFNTLPSVIGAFVFPALGGPSSDKLTILKGFDRDRSDYHRAFQSGALSVVRNAIHAQLSTGDEHVVGTADEQACDIALALKLPASSLSGGNGLGWLDQRPWPPAGVTAPVKITSTAQQTITVNAATAVAPIVGQTHFMWWSSRDMKMRTFLVIGVSGSSGAWVLTPDKPLVDDLGNRATTNEYISPACANSELYGTTFLDLMERLGCGENTADISRLPRSSRHPFAADGPDMALTGRFLADFIEAHDEISDGAIAYAPAATPAVPSTVQANPNVLVPRHFSVLVMP